jgi:hypothetical protein
VKTIAATPTIPGRAKRTSAECVKPNETLRLRI